MPKEEMNLYKRCKNIFKSHGVDMGGGGGFEYDFIIKTDGETYTLETGTYEAINAKLGNQPVNGKVIMFGEDQIKDMDCIFVGKFSWDEDPRIVVVAFMGEAYVSLDIKPDNTVLISL